MLGPSGSGKTTVLRLVAGFELADGGTVELGGRDVTRLAPVRARRQHRVPGLRALPAPRRARQRGVRAAGAQGRQGRAPRQRARDALAGVRLQGFEGRRPGQLSGGQRQRVALARALVNRPRVLLLDEPLGALDLKLREEMQVELKAIQREVGVTFVFVTHDQEEALSLSDRVAVFSRGRDRAGGHAPRGLRAPGDHVRGRLRRHVQPAVGAGGARAAGGGRPHVVRPERITHRRAGGARRRFG